MPLVKRNGTKFKSGSRKRLGGAWNVGSMPNAPDTKERKRPKICFGCSRKEHFLGDRRWPARHQADRKCGKIGHKNRPFSN